MVVAISISSPSSVSDAVSDTKETHLYGARFPLTGGDLRALDFNGRSLRRPLTTRLTSPLLGRARRKRDWELCEAQKLDGTSIVEAHR